MGRDLASEFPAAAQVFREADEILGRSLSDIAWNGPIEELTKTGNCQPALYVHGLACLAALRETAGDFAIEAAAGLSLGEWTAHAAAGTFDFATGLKLVEKRGQFMEAACSATAGAMAAMIGADESAVRSLAADTDVDVANLNAPGQIVISGEAAKVELAVTLAKEHGIRRATLLNVAGAYHSRLMNSAFLQMGEALLEAELQMPRFPIVSQCDRLGGRNVAGNSPDLAGSGHRHGAVDGLHGMAARAGLRFVPGTRTRRSPGGIAAADAQRRGCRQRERCSVGPGVCCEARLLELSPVESLVEALSFAAHDAAQCCDVRVSARWRVRTGLPIRFALP